MELPIQSMVAKARKLVRRSSAERASPADRSLRVLAIHRYYWPDTPPYASILRTITSHWATIAHQVEVLTSQPSYKPDAVTGASPKNEVVDGVHVHRLPLPSDRLGKVQKRINTALFPLIVFQRILFGRQHDVIMCSTAPPVLLGFAVAGASKLRNAQFVYHCMDIHPEIGALSGEFANRYVYRILRSMDEWACRNAAAVVVLSEDMAQVLIRRDPTIVGRVQVINNFDLPDYSTEPDPAFEPSDANDHSAAPVRIIFAGNLGRFQGLQDIIRATASISGRNNAVEIVFMGDGAAKKELVTLAQEVETGGSNIEVKFLPHGTPSQARALMRSADYGLVPLIPEVIQYAYPSKVATYLSESLPVIAVVENESELARMVVDREIGFVATPADTTSLETALGKAIQAKGSIPAMRDRAGKIATERFSREPVLEQWGELLNALRRAESGSNS